MSDGEWIYPSEEPARRTDPFLLFRFNPMIRTGILFSF